MSHLTRALCTATLLAALAPACGPSVDPAAKADIDRRVGLLQAPAATIPPPAPGVFQAIPFAPGQWTQYKMVDDKGQPSFLTYKVLAEEGGAFWLEMVSDTYYGRQLTLLLAYFGSRTDPSQLEIRAAKTKDSKGRVNEIPPTMMPMMQGLYRGMVSSLVLSWQGLPQEGTAVPAGRFDACFKTRSEAQWGMWRSTADGWSHPAVPVSGLVRSQGLDKPFTMELVAFGLTGAVSEF